MMSEDRSYLEKLDAVLPLFGHRNWIVVADAAYPAQCSPGVETIVAAQDFTEVLREVLERIDASGHISATAYLDAELPAVADEDAPGASAFRRELDCILAGHARVATAHEEIIAKLDEAGRRFRILMIKTPMRIPYTSVFLELGCGYWTADAEKRMRTALNGRRQVMND